MLTACTGNQTKLKSLVVVRNHEMAWYGAEPAGGECSKVLSPPAPSPAQKLPVTLYHDGIGPSSSSTRAALSSAVKGHLSGDEAGQEKYLGACEWKSFLLFHTMRGQFAGHLQMLVGDGFPLWKFRAVGQLEWVKIFVKNTANGCQI